jgi:hypothetical protein
MPTGTNKQQMRRSASLGIHLPTNTTAITHRRAPVDASRAVPSCTAA